MEHSASAKIKLYRKTLLCVSLASMLVCATLFPVLRVHSRSSSIIINEVLYDPSGADSGREWIELKNIGQTEIDLAGWKIQSGGASFTDKAVLPAILLPPGGIILIGEPSVTDAQITVPTLAFQNGGTETDGIRILDSSGNVIDTVVYDSPNSNNLHDDSGSSAESFAPSVTSGNSLVRGEDDTDLSGTDFFDCDTPTPGAENEAQNTEIVATIADAKAQPDDTEVTIEASVTAPLQTVFETETYAQDSTGGLRLKAPDGVELNYEETYIIRGKMDTVYGERRLVVASAKLSDNQIPIKPTPLLESGTTDEHIGLLVSTSGIITSQQGRYLSISSPDESTTNKVYIAALTEIETPEKARGKLISVVGIVSRYGTNTDGSPRLRIMPRFEEDISFSTGEVLGKTGSPLLWASICGSGLLIVASKRQRRWT